MEPRICPGCGGTRLHEGTLQDHQYLYFRMKSTKFFTLRSSSVRLTAAICADCGLVSAFGDVDQIRAIRPDNPEPR